MKRSSFPLKIQLAELPDQGESFTFDRQSGELNDSLKDLIGPQDYKVNLHLQPLGNAFEIAGEINASMNLVCTRCGRDMVHKLDGRFRELIVIEEKRPRAGRSGHTGLGFDNEIFCNYVTSPEFDLAEFVHEHIAAAEPYTVQCGQDDCEDTLKRFNEIQRPPAESERANPFAALKNYEFKSQKG